MCQKCLVCGFDNHVEGAEFCQHCGTYLINLCSNEHCDMNNGENIPLSNDARYCPYCGSPSTFQADGCFDEK